MEPSDKNSFDNSKIIIFDGDCAFCNRSVLFIRKHNKKDSFLFCPGQSEVAQKLIKDYNIVISPDESLIYLKRGKTHYFSSAPLEIAKELDHFWAMLSIFLVIPKFIRDKVYIFIAKNRKSILGEAESCSFLEAKRFEGRVLK